MTFPNNIFILKDSFFFDSVIQLLHSASREIILVNFLFSDSKKIFSPFINLFQKLSSNNVKIYIILNGTFRQIKACLPNRRIKDILHPSFAKVLITSGNRIEHRKIIIVDRKIVVLGSHNFTKNSLKINHELSICVKSNYLSQEIFDLLSSDYPGFF